MLLLTINNQPQLRGKLQHTNQKKYEKELLYSLKTDNMLALYDTNL